jgi:hypothetical protein
LKVLLQITMSKEDGVKVVVVGGRNSVKQQYCGTVGGLFVLLLPVACLSKFSFAQGKPPASPQSTRKSRFVAESM